MTYDQIQGHLCASERWGIKDQPDREVVAEVLATLPLVECKMLANDILYIQVSRSLLPSEVWALARLGQVAPERIGDTQTEFTLQWD